MRRPSAVPSSSARSGVALKDLDAIRKQLAHRRNRRKNVIADHVADFNIRWLDQGPSRKKSGYYATIDGKDLLLTPNAVSTANRLINSRPIFWIQCKDCNAFPKMLTHILDNKANDGYMIRHNGSQVNAVLPASYAIKDAHELLEALIDPIERHVGHIQGVSMIDHGDGDITSLRVVIGENIVKELPPEFGLYMMLLLNTSETGAIATRSILGLFRTICTNSAIRDTTRTAEWNHISDWDKFWDGTIQTLREFPYFSSKFGAVFSSLSQTKLEMPPFELLTALHREQLITQGHFDEAKTVVEKPTEDGRPVETHYDLFNVLTRAAQSLPSIAAQHRAEEAALNIFTLPGRLGAVRRRR